MHSATAADSRAVSPEIREVLDQLIAADRDAEALVAGLSEELGTRRLTPTSWSIAECLDHLATANRVYLRAMRPPAERALAGGSTRSRPALPGIIGRWFVGSLEPPVKAGRRGKAPRIIRPREGPALADAFAAFIASHEDAREFLRRFHNIDLARIRFVNPFVAGVRFSLATGVNVIAAHDRRHLWQAWNVRRAADQQP
jgi:hypothetical protein